MSLRRFECIGLQKGEVKFVLQFFVGGEGKGLADSDTYTQGQLFFSANDSEFCNMKSADHTLPRRAEVIIFS